jgi:1-aminocyclopropane-1-carboxylate deaminase
MGGVWSNHIHACAYWARTLGLACTVLLRGPNPKQPNQLLQDLAQWGTEIRFLTRNDYRALRLAYEHDQLDSISHLKDFHGYLFIPEGGCHPLAQSGIRQLAEEIQGSYKAVYIAVGTGTTVGGLISSWPNDDCHFYGIQAVTATASQERIIHSFLQHETVRLTLCADYQFGGFARVNDELIDFMLAIYAKTGLITEPVYTAKTLFALYDHIKQGIHQAGDRLLFIHTGGLQGLRGFQQTRLNALCSSAGFN